MHGVSRAQSDSYEDQQKALQTLASMHHQGKSAVQEQLLAQTDGAFISTLLSLSKSSSPVVIQTLSPSVLLNLSLNADLKQSLASIETAYISSQLASSLNYCRLAMVDKNKKAKFGVALPVKAISAHTCPAAGHHLLSSKATPLWRFNQEQSQS
ncbi:hypothetical protein WN944_000426 [Citrus x changshan-huyou]|uniref:Uncharacterized protein n=1 Tax=Citrus x changshan-huyou TaxID=2935761 RepID=A0AAP0MCU9_9ROSI